MTNTKIEEEKLQIEREKLEVERGKARIESQKTKWTAFSVVIPLVAGVLTIAYGIWTTGKQAQSQFELEVVKAILQSGSEAEAAGRLYFFRTMFPDRIPESFATRPGDNLADPGPRNELFRALVQGKLTPRQSLAVYKVLFNDEWIRSAELEDALPPDPPLGSGASK